MARPSGEKTRCNGQWTESKYINFIKNQLRGGSRKWAPIHTTLKGARVGRGVYHCSGCSQDVPVTVVDKGSKRRVKNVYVDHINPVVDPHKGFTTWDSFIERLFCEEDSLQVLCKECHDDKTKWERDIATNRRRKERENEKL